MEPNHNSVTYKTIEISDPPPKVFCGTCGGPVFRYLGEAHMDQCPAKGYKEDGRWLSSIWHQFRTWRYMRQNGSAAATAQLFLDAEEGYKDPNMC